MYNSWKGYSTHIITNKNLWPLASCVHLVKANIAWSKRWYCSTAFIAYTCHIYDIWSSTLAPDKWANLISVYLICEMRGAVPSIVSNFWTSANRTTAFVSECPWQCRLNNKSSLCVYTCNKSSPNTGPARHCLSVVKIGLLQSEFMRFIRFKWFLYLVCLDYR